MKKQLLFDDSRLFGKNNTVRQYGTNDIELVATYSDGICSTDYATGWVFRLDDGTYRLLYFGRSTQYAEIKLFAADSPDGIHFAPAQLHPDPAADGKLYPHEIMDITPGAEIGTIYENKLADPAERYVLFMVQHNMPELEVYDDIYTSPDLVHWTLKPDAHWANCTEPMVSVFYNPQRQCHTVVERPFWGVRTIGIRETSDFVNYSDYRFCLRTDSMDEDLVEIYGMHAFAYDGMYIGLPHLYRRLSSRYSAQYDDGIIDTQLAYSYDGEYWHRSLRTPFLSGVDGKKTEKTYNLLWVMGVQRADDGSILLYAAGSEYEHGPAFGCPGTGIIHVYRLREDGFIGLSSADATAPARIITREKIWNGGDLRLNLRAETATIGVYVTDEVHSRPGNALGIASPVDGFTHEECIPFSGDSTHWVPQWSSGKSLEELKGHTLVFEVRFSDGTLFSLSGDYTDVFNTEGARYRKFGYMPQI